MKSVECDKCEHFIHPVLKEEGNLISPIILNAKCELGKRVMFRMSKPIEAFNPDYYGGYIRFCNDYTRLSDVVSNI